MAYTKKRKRSGGRSRRRSRRRSRVGSKRSVYNGTAKETAGGLNRKDLKKNKKLNSVMMNTGRNEFVDCIKLGLFGDGCSVAVLTAEDVKPGDNKWVVEGNQYFSNQTSITVKRKNDF